MLIQLVPMANIGMDGNAKSSTVLHLHTSTLINVYTEEIITVLSVMFGMEKSVFSIQAHAHLVHHGQDLLVLQPVSVEMETILTELDNVNNSLCNALQKLPGMELNVLVLEMHAHLEPMLKEKNVFLTLLVKMVIFGIPPT